MIKVTREQLVMAEKSLGTLANARVPLGIAYRIKKIIKQVAELLQETEKIRHEIIDKYGKKDENGELIIDKTNNMIEIIPEEKATFNEEITLLFGEVCEITGEPIPANLLENVSISSQEINTIEPFLSFE